MITDVEIAAVVAPNGVDVVLTNMAQRALSNLVYRSKQYNDNKGYYGDVYAQIRLIATAAINQVGTGTEAEVMGQALGAVVNKLKTLPGIRVEDEGSAQAKSFFSSPDNWEELALDVLNILFVPPGGSNTQNQFAWATRSLCSDFPPDHRPWRNDEILANRARRWW